MCQIGSGVSNETGDLLAFGNALQRNAARGEPISLLARDFHVSGHRINEAGPALGTDRSGINRHKADSVPAILRSERKCQVLPGSDRRAWRDLPVRRFDPVIAEQVYDAPAPLLNRECPRPAGQVPITGFAPGRGRGDSRLRSRFPPCRSIPRVLRWDRGEVEGGGHQRAGVGVFGGGHNALCGAGFNDPAVLHDQDLVGQRAHDPQIVADEEIGEAVA